MNILDKIVAQKKIEIEQAKKTISINQLEQTEFFKRSTFSITSKKDKRSDRFLSIECFARPVGLSK